MARFSLLPVSFAGTIISLFGGFVIGLGKSSTDLRSNLQLVCLLGRAASFNSD